MKILNKLSSLPWLTLCLGVPAMVLMLLLRGTGLDSQNLFVSGHYAGILVWLLTAVMAVLLTLRLRLLGGKAKYGRMFPASPVGAVGILCAVAGILWSGWEMLRAAVIPFDSVAAGIGLLSGVLLAYLAWCRFRGIRGSFLLWVGVTVFLMLRLMFSYRIWSAQPELLHYCFPLLASVCLTLAFYYRTAFAVGLGNRRMYLFFTQMGGFFCLVTLAAGFDLFYAGMLVWSLTDLCILRPMKTGARESLPEDQP